MSPYLCAVAIAEESAPRRSDALTPLPTSLSRHRPSTTPTSPKPQDPKHGRLSQRRHPLLAAFCAASAPHGVPVHFPPHAPLDIPGTIFTTSPPPSRARAAPCRGCGDGENDRAEDPSSAHSTITHPLLLTSSSPSSDQRPRHPLSIFSFILPLPLSHSLPSPRAEQCPMPPPHMFVPSHTHSVASAAR